MIAKQGKALKEKLKASGDLIKGDYGVEYAIIQEGSFYVVSVWRPRAVKPTFHYRVRSADRAKSFVDAAISSAKSEAEYKAKKKSQIGEMRARVQVGSIFASSWGYEQTNVDFFQVVDHSASKATVTVRKIAAETIKETGWASARVRPVPDQFVGTPFQKRVSDYGISLTYGDGKLVKEGDTFHCSWYH